MRFLVVCLLAAAGLRAQAPLSGETALKKFKQKLASLRKFVGESDHTQVYALGTPGKLCAIPLLMAPVATKSVDPKIVIGPNPNNRVHYHILQVIPPAPACDQGNISWKE